MILKIAKEPNENTINVFNPSTQKKIGKLTVSEFGEGFSWNGEEVISFFMDVLTDCNYHTERRLIEMVIKKLENAG